MPVMGGFELLSGLNKGPMPVVIMVTAYDHHAIRAFEAGAVDYLLKPISPQRLLKAVERAERISRNPAEVVENIAKLQELAPLGQPSSPKLRKIVGKLGEEYFLLSPSEVMAFQADGDSPGSSRPSSVIWQHRIFGRSRTACRTVPFGEFTGMHW